MTQPNFTPLCEYAGVPLKHDQSEILLRLLMLEKSLSEEEFSALDSELSEEAGFLYQALVARVKFHDISYRPTALVIIMELCDGNIGKSMSMLHSLAIRTVADKPITVEDFCNVFPMGVPNESNWDSFWDNQKSATGVNMIDIGKWSRATTPVVDSFTLG